MSILSSIVCPVFLGMDDDSFSFTSLFLFLKIKIVLFGIYCAHSKYRNQFPLKSVKLIFKQAKNRMQYHLVSNRFVVIVVKNRMQCHAKLSSMIKCPCETNGSADTITLHGLSLKGPKCNSCLMCKTFYG